MLFACGLVIAATLLAAPASALALGVPTGPMTVRAPYGFETAYPSDFSTARFPYVAGFPNARTYIWGPITTVTGGAHGGSNALWCAGWNAISNTPYTNYAGDYPKDTAGYAYLGIPQLTNYYSADLSFWYLMPSLGSGDTNSYSVAWGPNKEMNPSSQSEFRFPIPLTASWSKVTYDITADHLSRQAGVFRWTFVNLFEPEDDPLPPLPPYVRQGKGTSIDDVEVKGYMFGPVRDLQATSVAAGAKLSWKRPYRAENSVTLEERAIEYRIWRRLVSQPNGPWTDVTSGGAVNDPETSVDYLDSTAVPGETYHYRVVAFAQGETSQYGEFADTEVHVLNQAGIDVTAQPTYTKVTTGTKVSYTYQITNTGLEDITDLEISDTLGSVLTLQSTTLPSEDSTTVTSNEHTLTQDTNNTVTVSGDANGTPVSDSEPSLVEVYDPSVSLSVSPTSRTVNAGRTTFFDVNVKNTGDSPLGPITLKVGGSNLAVIDELAAGATASRRYAPQVNSTTTYAFTADAKYGSPSTPAFNGTESASTQGTAFIYPSRVAGADRIATAIALSKQAFPAPLTGEKAVVLATAYDYPDALSAASLAGAVKGPLLLVRDTSVPPNVAEEIKRLGASKAYIVGGTAVVSEGVRSYLQTSLGLTVERLAGPTRYGTAAAVARETRDIAGKPSRVFVATGLAFPDALAASSLAAELSEPILLTPTGTLSPEAAAVLSELKPSTVVVCGGTGAVSASVASQLAGTAFGSPAVVRQGGATRYDTAKLLAEYGEKAISPSGFDGMLLATGTNFPDALAGGVAAAAGDGWRPLMLTLPTALSPQASALLSARDSVAFVAVVGGEGAVTETVLKEALSLLQ